MGIQPPGVRKTQLCCFHHVMTGFNESLTHCCRFRRANPYSKKNYHCYNNCSDGFEQDSSFIKQQVSSKLKCARKLSSGARIR